MKTIEYKGVTFEIEYSYSPAEKMVMYYPDGTGHPGCAASVELEQITHNGVNFWEILEDNIEEIEILILENILDE